MRVRPGLSLLGALATALVAACAPAGQPPGAQPAPSAAGTAFRIPIEYHTLDNGLKVVLSPDRTAPTAVVAVYYNIGFRIEPRDRTGFAHLFEHMMFQGSENLGKMEFIRLVQSNGGVLNGSTRFDYTAGSRRAAAGRAGGGGDGASAAGRRGADQRGGAGGACGTRGRSAPARNRTLVGRRAAAGAGGELALG